MLSKIRSLAFAASFLRFSQAFPNHAKHSSHQHSERALLSADASSIISAATRALGGTSALNQLQNITYHAPHIYRSQTLTQSYNLDHSDQTVATSGSQNISFSFVGDNLHARVERHYNYDAYWIWAFPDLRPAIDFTYVLSDGPPDTAYAYFTRGQNSFFAQDPSQALGAADSHLADYLYHHAQTFAIPGLISYLASNTSNLQVSSVTDPITNVSYPAVLQTELGVLLVLDKTSNLPYLIRSYEDHAIFGNSTNDVILSDYKPVELNDNASLNLPHRFQTVYNSKDVIEDFLVETITLNPIFPHDFFAPLPNGSGEAPSPTTQPEDDHTRSAYTRAEVHDFFEAGLWSGVFNHNISSVVSSHPVPSIPQIHAVYIGDYADYVQLVVEFETGVLVTDAPPHRSDILIDWVKQTLHKNITHVVISHHHHDHSYGIADFVRAGAAAVVPDVAAEFYQNVNRGDINVITYNESAPFILRDANVQFHSFYHPDPPHARDWTYGVAMEACSGSGNETDAPAVMFNADVWSPGDDALRFDLTGARQWLDFLVQDRVPLRSVVVGAHGSVDSDGGDISGSTTQKLKSLVDIAAYNYPDFGKEEVVAAFC